MFGLYVFSLVIGGAFLLLSLFGDAFDSDVDGLEGDVDIDSVDGSGLWKVLSIRSVVYAMFGFGAVGTALTLSGLMTWLSTLAFASVTGVASGALISAVFGWVKRTEAGKRTTEREFEGLLGDVTVPFGNTNTGQIAVSRGGRRHVLLARPHSTADGSPETWTKVVVVELEQGVARVAPAGPDLLAAAPDDA